jgi:ABC-type amino acid transport substrate-binding protein
VLLDYGQGALRNDIVHVASGYEVAGALREGRTAAGLARRTELEAGLRGVEGFAIEAPPVAVVNRLSWVLGMAVTADNAELQEALEAAMRGLVQSGELQAIFAREGVTWHEP